MGRASRSTRDRRLRADNARSIRHGFSSPHALWRAGRPSASRSSGHRADSGSSPTRPDAQPSHAHAHGRHAKTADTESNRTPAGGQDRMPEPESWRRTHGTTVQGPSGSPLIPSVRDFFAIRVGRSRERNALADFDGPSPFGRSIHGAISSASSSRASSSR